MCGVIVVDVGRSRSTCLGRDAYIHDNYAQFCQLLNSNSFTHHRILMLLREATSETYGPQVYLHHINLPIVSYLLCFYFTLHLYHKNTKNIILSSLSDLTFASGRVGIDNPFITLVASSLFVCVGSWDLLRSLLLD